MARCIQLEHVDHPKMTQDYVDFSDKSASTEEKEFDLTKLVNPCDAIKAQRIERRTSERIQQAMVMDNLSLGQSSKKRTLEGTSSPSSNSFSILNNAEILAKSVAMGVDMKTDDFDSINILRNTENARNAIHNKQSQQDVCSPIIESIMGITTNLNSDEEATDSDIDSFTIVTFKRNRKPVVRLSLSGRKPPNHRHKENPCGGKKSQKHSKSKI